MGYLNGILYRNLVLLAGIFWARFRSLPTTLFDFVNGTMFSRYVTGERGNLPTESSGVHGEKFSDDVVHARVQRQVHHVRYNDSVDEEEKPDAVGFEESMSEEKDSPKFLSFRFPSLEEYVKSNSTHEDLALSEKSDVLSCNKFGEEAEASCSGTSANSEELSIDSMSTDDPFQSEDEDAVIEKIKAELMIDLKACHKPKTPQKQEELGKEDISKISEKCRWLSEKELLVSESDSDSLSSSYDFSLMSRLLDSNSEEGLFSDGDSDKVSELNNILNSTTPANENEKSEASVEEDDKEFKDCRGLESTPGNDDASDDGNEKFESQNQSSAWDSDDSKLESMWEHQDLIEQLKMELEKARRATGLPTIPEDSECPKIMEDLKPWKIDDKVQHEDTMDELHKVYKSYSERMRKFDILNYQKMYALGFLQTKDPVGFISTQKPTDEGITSLLSQTCKLCKDKKPENDPMVNFIRELHSDLETVYVGQMCLSWEFLHWQYIKALELWESDHNNLRQYNEVAGKFQQFQVVLQRFLENERFEGPRVHCYVKTRYFLRNLLQIPVIKEDSLKDRRKAKLNGKGGYAITSDVLVEILEESIRIFWRFVCADKDLSYVFQKCRKASKPELQNPKDSELLAEVQMMLQKNEKQLKDLLKGGNCILRKFRKHQDDTGSDQVLYFFSQVDMKLVKRVMNMSRLTTDQISWCCSKLSKIIFVGRKMHVEPSFSLFPC